MDNIFIHPTAVIDSPCQIGAGTKIWHFAHIRQGAEIGENCIIGKGCYIDANVKIGDGVKIQNGVSVYQGVTIEEDVFIGPNATFTNDKYPRARGEWQVDKTLVRKGASIGANATIICGVEIGEDAMVGAGAVVTKNVTPGSIVVGNPAKQINKSKGSVNTSCPAVRLGIVGTGKMGQYHLRAALEAPNAELTGFYDESKMVRELIVSKYPMLCSYHSLDELYDNIDAVIIASPSQLHFGQVDKALNAGIHVLCEKPLTLNADSSRMLMKKASLRGLILQPGQIERYNPAFLALEENINGMNIIAVECCRTGPYSAKYANTSIVYDLLVHDLDIVIALLKEDLSLISAWGKKIFSHKMDIVMALLQSESGIMVNLMASRVTNKRSRKCKIHALNKYIESDLLNKRISGSKTLQQERVLTGLYHNIEQQCHSTVGGQDQLKAQLSSFLSAIVGKEPAICNDDIKRVARLLDEIENKAGKGEK